MDKRVRHNITKNIEKRLIEYWLLNYESDFSGFTDILRLANLLSSKLKLVKLGVEKINNKEFYKLLEYLNDQLIMIYGFELYESNTFVFNYFINKEWNKKN